MDAKTLDSALSSLKNALHPVAHLMDDPLVQEIEINGENDIWVERDGTQAKTDIAITKVQIDTAIQVLARLGNKDARAGTKDAIIDARMNGFRVAAALAPTSVRGSSICIRKHNPVVLTLDDYVKAGSFDESWAQFIRDIIGAHKNILIAGGTSSGKTTFANALIGEVDMSERVVTIEDTPELKVKVPNWVSLESNEQAQITTRDLVRLALRYRPDRIFVGEIRGGEAYNLLDAANTGHDGVLSTIHANSAFDALARFESLILQSNVQLPHAAICTQIARTFDYVLFMARIAGRRRLCQVLELTDYDIETRKYQCSLLFDEAPKREVSRPRSTNQ